MATSTHNPTALARNLHTTLSNHKGPVHVARYAKGSAKYVLSGGQDRTVRLWNPSTGAEIKVYAAHGYEVLSLTVSHDNNRFASSGGDRSVFLWDVSTGQTIRRIAGHMGKINAVEFNDDTSVLASGSYDSTVRLWDLRAQNRQPIQILEEARDAVQALHISHGTILTGSVDGHVRAYDLRMGQLRSDFIGAPVTAVMSAQDGQSYLVTTLDSNVRLMDAATGKMLNGFKGHKAEGYRCRSCFGHGEASVICGDESGTIWAWDLLDAVPLPPTPPPKVHQGVVLWVEHHPTEDGEMISAGADGTVKVWRH